MSKTKQIIRHILHEIGPPFIKNSAIIYRRFFQFYARGIMIEQTPYKDTYFLRRFCLPVFGADDFVHVSYSPRVTRDTVQDWVGEPRVVAEQVLDWMQESNFLDDLNTSYAPADFIAQFDVPDLAGASSPVLYDLSASLIVSENTHRGDLYLQRCEANCIRNAARFPPDYKLPKAVQALRSAMDCGADVAQRHLRAECRRNATALGFTPAPLPA